MTIAQATRPASSVTRRRPLASTRPSSRTLLLRRPSQWAIRHNPAVHGEGRVCPRCEKKNPAPWTNPILATLAKLQRYQGPILGGYVLCAACEPLYEADRQMAQRQATFGETANPPEFAEATWETFLPRAGTETAVDVCRVWYHANDGRCLYLTGPVGSGKTRLACTLAAATFRDRTTSVLFVHVADLFDRLRAAEMKGPGEDDHFRIPALVARTLLVLDDLGVEKPTDYTCTRLLQLLERRHQAGHPTIITSNLGLDALGQRLGDDRIPSRLADWADLAIVRASDYRLERAGTRATHRQRRHV